MKQLAKDSRRKFIKASGMATLGFMGLYQFMNPGKSLAASSSRNTLGYGPLKKDPAGILNLPEGFSYKILSKKGDKMSDGLYLPGLADGMGAFQEKMAKRSL